MAALPHRYPMLLVDRVESLDPDKGIVAIKAVTINEPFFQGHFPARPIMPGVLIVEALAQAAGVLAVEALGLAGSGKLVYFMAIEGAKFRSRSNPACCSGSRSSSSRSARSVCKFAGRATVDGKLAAEASFTAMIADPPPPDSQRLSRIPHRPREVLCGNRRRPDNAARAGSSAPNSSTPGVIA